MFNSITNTQINTFESFPTLSKREILQSFISNANNLDDLLKVFSYIPLSKTKAFLSSEIEELPNETINKSYYGVRSIEDILCRELLISIFSFLPVFERFHYSFLSRTFSEMICSAPPTTDLTHYQSWISFDLNQSNGISIHSMLFLYQKPHATYAKLNPLKLDSLIYFLNKLSSSIVNFKIGALGLSVIDKIMSRSLYNGHNCSLIRSQLRKWLCNLSSIAFIANDVDTINQFLNLYQPNLIYLSLDSLRYNQCKNQSISSLLNLSDYDEFQEAYDLGYDAPQPTPTPGAVTCGGGGSSSSLFASPIGTLSSDYSASDDDLDNFYFHDSSDGYHCEGHRGKYNQKRRHSHSNGRSTHKTLHSKNKRRRVAFQFDSSHSHSHRKCTASSLTYSRVCALQILSSYSPIRISCINYLFRNIQFLGCDINLSKQTDIVALQQMIYSADLSPHLVHLSMTGFKHCILIPNRIHSLVIQRWKGHLSCLDFECQFFPYNICANALTLPPLNKRLLSSLHSPIDLSSSEQEQDQCNVNDTFYDLDSPYISDLDVATNTSNDVIPNTSSQLFEIKMLFNFDLNRNRWLILKEQFEFLCRLKCIESLTVIHLVMVEQSVLNKHCNQYSLKKKMQDINENDSLEIYDFPKFNCKWHHKLVVIAPRKCHENVKFKETFPLARLRSIDPMIPNKYLNAKQRKLKKKLKQISDLFAVGQPNQLQSPS